MSKGMYEETMTICDERLTIDFFLVLMFLTNNPHCIIACRETDLIKII